MRELITERHSKGPATTVSNKSGEAVDGIWGTAGTKITAGGYFPFYYGILSNHCVLWVKILLTHALGNPEPPLRRPNAIILWMKDKRARSRHNYINKQFLKRH
eukprot:4308124-Ditylum_brightwellii.AAC.1